MDEILQLKITLDRIKPPIWRRVLVKSSISFDELHEIIQIAMGWDNYHLYEFEVSKTRVSNYEDDFGGVREDSDTLTLADVWADIKKFTYVYDFGDHWEHLILIEKVLPIDAHITYPICTAGALRCPPEDCGGIPGFYHMLAILEDKKHPEHADMLEWIGEDFDAEDFDINLVNAKLKARAH
jgi:hypothetical protein